MQGLNHLEELDASGTLLSDGFLSHCAPTFRVAKFADCQKLGGSILSFVARNNKLQSLDISYCQNVSYSICVSLFGSFWPPMIDFKAVRAGSLQFTHR